MSTDVEMAIQDTGGGQASPPPLEYPDVVESISIFLVRKVQSHDRL